MANEKKRKKSVAKKPKRQRKLAQKRKRTKQLSLVRKKKFSPKRRRVTGSGLVVETVPFPSERARKGQDRESGDLQGLSNRPLANSESVVELLEEGNALEAETVQGVESAPDADHGDVQTREVREDDVPEEYLDEDR